MKKTYRIEIDCANCARLAEEAVAALDGVCSVTLNFMAQKLTVEYADTVNESALLRDIKKTCRKIDRDFEIC